MFSHDNWGNKKLPRGGKRDKDKCDKKIPHLLIKF